MRVGLVHNRATQEHLHEAPELTLNLCDSPETIEAVTTALEAGGHRVTPLVVDRHLPEVLVNTPFDIIFNIATGFHGSTRQANIPAMLEYLSIPYTGGDVRAETVTNHKPVMKTLLRQNHLPTPRFQTFDHAGEPLKSSLRFPLIVKLPAEGGSLGLEPSSVVHNRAQLRAQVAAILDKYNQGALVEEFVGGREFTVPVLGNDPPYALPVVERIYYGDVKIQLDEPEPSTLSLYRQMMGHEPDYTEVDNQSVAPADLSAEATAHIQSLAVAAFRALGCRDWARIDLRMDHKNRVYILDVNLEPAITPDYALAKSAYATGWSYQQLVNRILNHAAARYPHLRQNPDSSPNGRVSSMYDALRT